MNIFVKTGLVVALSAVSSFALADAPAATEKAGDIAAAVRSEINKSVALRADHLSVQAVKGVVYVRGMVDTDLERIEAGAAAIKAASGAKVVNMTETANN